MLSEKTDEYSTSRLKDILRRKDERLRKLKSSLESIVKQLRELGALKIIFFGSVVEGEVDVNSDLDLLVIMPSTRSGKEWMKLVYEKTKTEVATDVIVYNHREFEEKLPTSSFLKNVVNTGRVVYEETV